MAQNVNPDQPHTSSSKQNDETVTVKDNHAVSKRSVSKERFWSSAVSFRSSTSCVLSPNL